MSGNFIRPGGAGGASWGELPGEGHNLVVAGRREGSLSPGRAVQLISVVETPGRSVRGLHRASWYLLIALFLFHRH